MSLGSRYNPEDVEKKWYSTWESSGLFNSKPDGRESFTILIPPPNVTGVLHMGHMLNNTIQDVLIRKARMQGMNACWVPGMDHASIATEAKVVRQLREKGIKKSDLSRDEFLKHAWDWTDNYGGIILQQLKRLGASPDWDRTAFTMDETRYDAVIKAFIDLYNAGKLYRGLRMVNWDPEAKTVLSNEEVLYKEENSKLYYIKYRFESSDDYITIATTRPETLLGDTAVAVHPGDEKYTHLNDTRLLVPLLNRSIPLIRDEYVDMEFGTGALKVTPAHDPNDYELGIKHNLEVIDIFNDDGSLSETAEIFIGMDRFEARKAIVAELKNQDLLVKNEDIRNNVGRSERTNCVVEPKLSLQWYVDMKSLAEPALKAVESGEIKFHPEKYINTYKHWMNNIRDWCISRQLWWGHRIPAYYYEDNIYVAATKEEAYEQALNDFPELKAEQLRQDEDVLDTWFSSWLWPISVFDGFNKRD
ncbi:MAG: valine--tRNA ligase, partial [Saprospiraceae bacterium]